METWLNNASRWGARPGHWWVRRWLAPKRLEKSQPLGMKLCGQGPRGDERCGRRPRPGRVCFACCGLRASALS